MSVLIDKLVKEGMCTNTWVSNGWYIAKPIGLQVCSLKTFIEVYAQRVANAIEVLLGKATAVHYKEDEIKKMKCRIC